jgi:autotransporter-associated beta strand protein
MDVTNFSDASGTWLDERGWSNTVNQEWVVTGTSGSAPAAPAGLTATAGVGQISVSWPSVSGATQYNVKRGTTSGGPYTTSLGSPTSATFTDTGASNGVTYYYVVSAVNASGVSGKSSQASATLGGIPPPPAAPGGLTATAVSSSQINLTWTDNSTNESNFLIEESLDNATFTQVDSVAAGVTNDSITGLAASTLYYFRVRVGNAGGNSDYSNTNSATTLAPPAGLVWCGDGAGNVWDVGVTANWLTGGSLVPFTNSAPVTFDDTGSNNVPVTLSGVPQPAVIVIGAAKNYTFSGGGQIGGSGSLIKTGSGLLTINTTNTYAGGTVISNGMVIIGNIGANSAAWGSGPITLVGGAIQFNGYGGSSGTGWGGLANPLNVPAGQTGTLLLPPRWGYSQPFTSALTGGGTLNVTVDYIRDFISGDWSAFTGQINIGPRSGTGDFRVDNAAGYAGAAFYLGGGVNFYVINHNSLTLDIGALDGDAGAVVGSGNGSSTNPTFRIGAKNTTNTFGGTIVDSGVTSLIKTGTGTLILTGANTYSGGTTISGGELRVNSSGGSGTGFGAVMVASGGTLGGGGIISGATTVNSGGTLSPGNLPGALTFSNSLTLNSGSTNIFEISKSPLTNDVANIYGVLTCGGTLIVTNIGVSALGAGDSFKLFNAAGYSGAFSKVILPSLPAGLVWNANALNTAGTLSVVVATAPVIGPVLLSGTNLVFAGTGGVANANFYLLGSTDVSLPLTNWTRLLTNQFDDGGNFNFTNSIPPDAPQDFYLLQLP